MFAFLFGLLLVLQGNVQTSVAISSMNLMEAQHSFADTLTANLYANDNDFTSALGVSMAFGLIYPSSIGASREEMENVFGYDQYFEEGETATNDVLVWDETATSLESIYSGADYDVFGQTVQEPLLSIANSVWVRNTVQLNQTYSAILGDLARPLDFDDSTAGSTINAWVDDSTNGLIDSIVAPGPLDSSWVLVAINSLYLKAAWANPFFESLTSEDTFYTNVLRDTPTGNNAHFMHMVEYAQYSASALPGFQVLRLPFDGSNTLSRGLSMLFVLPMSTGLATATSRQVITALPELQRAQVAIALPRFRFESEYSDSLKAALQKGGLQAPFEGDLCVLENSCEANVDFVIQKTVIDVHEKGVEAAAVTAVAVSETSSIGGSNQAYAFLCDHPVQVFIYDTNQNAVLFEGRVGDPGVSQNAGSAPFQGQHAEEDFWKTHFGVDIVNPASEYDAQPTDTVQDAPTEPSQDQTTSGNGFTKDPPTTAGTFQDATVDSGAMSSLKHSSVALIVLLAGLFILLV